jgi:hypothetical protein
MQRFRPDDFWFEMVSLQDPDGGYSRYQRVTCHKCGQWRTTRSTGLGEPALKKLFQRYGWHIGKNRGAHICAACQRKEQKQQPAPKVAPAITPVVEVHDMPNPIGVAWASASDDDKLEFAMLWNSEIDAIIGPKEPRCSWCANQANYPVHSTYVCDECVHFVPKILALFDSRSAQSIVLAWERCNRDERGKFLQELLEKSEMTLRQVSLYQVTEPGLTGFDYNEVITEHELRAAFEKYGEDNFTVERFKGPLPARPPPPVETVIAEPISKPVSEPVREYVSEPADDDDEPADWWKELTGQQ